MRKTPSNSQPTSRSHSPAGSGTAEQQQQQQQQHARSYYLSPPASGDSAGIFASELLRQNNNQANNIPATHGMIIDRGDSNDDMQRSGSLTNITSGFHMPPEVLGRALSEDDEEQNTGTTTATSNNDSGLPGSRNPSSSSSRKSRRQSANNGGDGSGSATQSKNRPSPKGFFSPDLNKHARKRSMMAVKATKTQAAAAAAVKGVAKYSASSKGSSTSKTEDTKPSHDGSASPSITPPTTTTMPTENLVESSLFTVLSYEGMEVIFSTVGSTQNTTSQQQYIVGVCSRTNYAFQTLNLASSSVVVSISSDSTSGMIVVAHKDGIIRTYMPAPTDPVDLSHDGRRSSDEFGNGVDKNDDGDNDHQGDEANCMNSETSTSTRTQARIRDKEKRPKSVYGRYRWIDGITIDTSVVFYQPGEDICFGDRRCASPGSLVDISTSYDGTFLVAHRRQLAVFDSLPLQMPDNNNDNTCVKTKEVSHSVKATQQLLWTTILPSNIVTAKMSGDGQALVVVLSDPDKSARIGAHTFLHDNEDGSQPPAINGGGAVSKGLLERTTSVGMVFKPGPFLAHSTPVTRLSFRGLGHLTPSANPYDLQGNDLLLTHCAEDSAFRIFNQSSWKQLMLWTAPPSSRAGWIRGSSAFSLGDLESRKKNPTNSRLIRPGSRRPSSTSAELSSGTGSVNTGLHQLRPSSNGSLTSSAGAWIAEITFRGAYPALRLSRLSYMKRGTDDSQPAHFESIAAILPAGSIIAASVLDSDDMGLSIHGIWPAWNPWLSETTENGIDDVALSGSAMKFLGLSSVPPPNTNAMFGESYAGGTHGPPTELRLFAVNPRPGEVVVMDFPLWGDDDFGAMELGSPIRNVLALSEICSLMKEPTMRIGASMDYESNRLCAQVEDDFRSISLLWRKQGSMSIYSTQWIDEDTVFMRPTTEVAQPRTPDLFVDLSAVPVPIALPPLRLPGGTTYANDDAIVAVKWWPDDSFGGPPLLVAVTKSTTLLVYEIPPPLFALEPTMPDFDSFNGSSSLVSGTELYAISQTGSDDEGDINRQEYDVSVTPHPDFGLGLRLESPMDGLPAIAGSFKRNPLNDGMLPAEKTGVIHLGDELLSVNGVSLENMTFDDIIGTVRHVGAKAGPGEPLRMRFRPVPLSRSRKNSAVVQESFSVRSSGNSSPKLTGKIMEGNLRSSDEASLAAFLFSSSAEAQQEFGRVIAVLRKAVTPIQGNDFSNRLIVLPLSDNLRSSSSSNRIRASALLLYACRDTVYVQLIELPMRTGLDKARSIQLGQVDVKGETDGRKVDIKSIHCINGSGDTKCFSVVDSVGVVRLLYLNFKAAEDCGVEGSPVVMEHDLFCAHGTKSTLTKARFRSADTEIFATMDESETPRRTIKLWQARCDSSCRQLSAVGAVNDIHFGTNFIESDVVVEPSEYDSELIDFCFMKTGCLDSSPTLVAFLSTEAVVYQRRGGTQKFLPVIRLSYPALAGSSVTSSVDELFGRLSAVYPCDAFPHILVLIRVALNSYDERNYLMSDWNPESLLGILCTDERGSKMALQGDIKRILVWLSDRIDTSHDDNFLPNIPLLVAPLALWASGITAPDKCDDTVETFEVVETAAHLFGSFGTSTNSNAGFSSQDDTSKRKLERLLDAVTRHRSVNESHGTARKGPRFTHLLTSDQHTALDRADEEGTTSDIIPPVLAIMRSSELMALEAILKVTINPPRYGKLDKLAQLCLTIFYIHKHLKELSDQEEKIKHGERQQMFRAFHIRHKASDYETENPKLQLQNASAGCLAALMSDYQDVLVDTIRRSGENLDWQTLRNLRVPFWLRSDDKLRQLSEEVGHKMYRNSKDILKSSIFFIIAGKKRTLMNLAAADSTDQGRKLFKFMTTHDFSSDRGRAAAEKNAFSLLRKNNYDAASAFFLLAEPPIIKSAVETIATKMEDIDLAFLVARLVKGTQTNNLQSMRFGATGSLGMGGVLGGGGGYAGSGSIPAVEDKDSEGFQEWKREIGQTAKRLILDRCLPMAKDDSCLSAVLLLWMGRFDEASHWLTGLLGCNDGTVPCFVDTPTIPQLQDPNKKIKNEIQSTIYAVNSFINFSGGPLLLRHMNASPRTQDAASLVVFQSLAKAGIEVPALRWLHQNKKDNLMLTSCGIISHQTPKVTNEAKQNGKPIPPVSSIFDSFDVAPPPNQQAFASDSAQMSSSIFDAFDAAPPLPRSSNLAQPSSASIEMSSSIFDSFDVPPLPKLNTALPVSASESGQMSSSIFDSFDVTSPPGPKPDQPSNIHLGLLAPKEDEFEFEETSELREQPKLWDEWRRTLIIDVAARRVIREVATLCARFHADEFDHTGFGKNKHPFVTSHAAQVLQFHADGDDLIADVRSLIENVSYLCKVDSNLIVHKAIHLLMGPYQFYRMVHVVLLLLAIKKEEQAEDVVRNAAQSLIDRCSSLGISNNYFANGRNCVTYVSTLCLQKLVAHISWQLELCLWIHRGGALPLSGLALKETICAARTGFLIASWNRDFEVQETMIKYPPDCLMNDVGGKQLWSSLKLISGVPAGGKKKGTNASSGGWEFLVDCKRSEATAMLKPRPTGCFIIRPHPEDHGVFTLSFKTNLVPTEEDQPATSQEEQNDNNGTNDKPKPPSPPKMPPTTRPIKKDDVVQHAIIRLSDSGFRCGSFGPFATLLKLLEAVSISLPFNLRFDLPPTEGIIKDDGSKPSPNSVFIRKLGMHQTEHANMSPMHQLIQPTSETNVTNGNRYTSGGKTKHRIEERHKYGTFLQLLLLSEIRKQLSSVAAAEYENSELFGENDDIDSVGSVSDVSTDVGVEQAYAIGSRILRPLLNWCRMTEVAAVGQLAPLLDEEIATSGEIPVTLAASETEIEISTVGKSTSTRSGDGFTRRMIQPGSGVEFRTLRLGDGSENAMVVLFSKKDAVTWFLKNGVVKREKDASELLKEMEQKRIVEQIDLRLIAPKAYKKNLLSDDDADNTAENEDGNENGIRFRLVDPWEVEPLPSRDAETRGASLGRQRLLAFGLGRVSIFCQDVIRSIGGLHMLELWSAVRGGICLTKALATVHAPWERSSGGDMMLINGSNAEPPPYDNSIREHLYRNALFRSLHLPPRFVALIQVELLDLKNLTSPGGSLSLTVYSLLRLKRARSNAPLTPKARTLDSVATPAVKLAKSSGPNVGPNAPASWGSLVRFRFPLPEGTGIDGKSFDGDREALFKGPPSVLQVSVYEKKFMSDTLLGGADVKLDGLSAGGQLEEWVPLKTEAHGINWFARIRLTLRFELMCLANDNQAHESILEEAPSPSIDRIKYLCSVGGAQLDLKKSVSTPDLFAYFESMM